MLPATLVTITTFLLEMCTASPVYNMQPAFITANIGTTGRNIRNLPCISRKNNQSGVCMFAIDCLKANGTHLGTCIDRFYFGSCCHIDHEILDNNIIPSREPPFRLSSTIKPTTPKTEATTSATSTTSTTTTTTTTRKPTTTSERITIQTTRKKLTTTPKPTPQPTEETTIGYKLTTFQSVDGSLPPETTTVRVVQQTTSKPTTNKPSSKPPTRPKPTKTPTPKPTKTTTKPPRVTTRKPVSTTTTRKPFTTTKPTKRLTTTTRTTTTTSKPITSSTAAPKPATSSPKPATTSSPKPATTSSSKPVTTSSSKPVTTSTLKPATTSSPKPATTGRPKPAATIGPKPVATASVVVEASTKPVVDIKKNITAVLQPVDGNPATNEIEAASSSTTSTTQPAIVTWTVDVDKNVSAATAGTTVNSTSEEWVPVTPPDGWVLLPSLQNTTAKPAMEASSTVLSSSTEESTSKPSITYIPFESTSIPTTPALNTSSATTQGASTPSTPVATASPATTSSPDEVRPVNMSDFTDVCGRRMYPEARIVGGEKSSFGKWPWQISLRQWRTSTYLHKCGAALLNENWAITAAHCVDNVPPSDLLLRLGEHDLSTETEPYLHQERRVQIVASHPQFDPRTFEYDLALLRFYEPVTFQPNILPVCVPQADENFVGRTAYVTGWGRLYEDGPLPSVLQEVSVPVINNSVCESMYRSAGYIEHIPHIFICAGWRRGGFDSCEGDSGGPMVIQREDKRFLLAGVISWGIGCAEPNQPGVYTRISEFKDWINQILQF